ncbi:hypothetical protein MBLNU457_7697t1 [Dothideomycetes sp. NU457]
MSDEEIVAGPPGATRESLAMPDLKPKYKSWRKKYRKMKARFDDVIKDNNTLFKEEQKLEALSKRLQEQNDQLLDLLLELNSSLQIPSELRYDVSLNQLSETDRTLSLNTANTQLAEVHAAVDRGAQPADEYMTLRLDLEARLAQLTSGTTIDALESHIPHPFFDPEKDTIPPHIAASQPIAFLTSAHEDEYLDRLDEQLGKKFSLSGSWPAQPHSWTSLTPRELEREVELSNPQSVHNWLKRHNVSVGVGVGEDGTASEAGGAATPANKTKGGSRTLAKKVGDRAIERAKERDEGSPMSSAAGAGFEEDVLGLGYEVETPRSGKGKKRGDDDHAYRPKGGSGKKAKRKREDGEGSAERKKARTSVAAGE